MTKADILAQALDDFLAVSADVEAAAVVSADGLPMASALPEYVEEDRLAAMSAALLTLGERAADGLGKGDLAQVFVEGAHGHVVLMAAGPDAVLVTVTTRAAKVGLVLFEMRRTAAAIATVMASPAEQRTVFDEDTSLRAPEPTPAAEVEPHLSTWQ
jgi:predicted regulator of Ras-like GTPase activity (Roadblock/LC7/MglB family)